MAEDSENKADIEPRDVDQTAAPSMPVWKDDDDDLEEDHDGVAETSEPEWVIKRRRELLKAQDTGELDAASALTGKLAKVKPSSRTSGVRFRIDRQGDSRYNISVDGGIGQVGFDQGCSVLAVLGRRSKSVLLYEVDRHRSEGKYFRLKGEMSSPSTSGEAVSSFAFSDEGKSMLLVTNRKSVMKYDMNQNSTLRISSLTNPRTESMYSRVHTPPASDDEAASVYALSCSDHGGVLLCDARSNAIMHHFQMNAVSVGVGFHYRAGVVITADKEANIYEWDLATGRCLHKFKDDHSLHLSSFAISPGAHEEFSRHAFVAAGSQMGFLNLFPLLPGAAEDEERSCIKRDLLKSYGNLSTPITSISADDSGKFIAYGSEHKKNALRIIHNPSGCVIGNWPTENVGLGRVTDVAFASRFSTLAVGNRAGRVQFFRILTT
ncbi:WD-40 repeat containing protein, putative [Babesia ovata]|uniref:WD-40 repeat containing protein, putative n=1 Tax=Babesia ovata TaxID=189622 RepID=A0A2H6KA35_9APIC|nr:WD-40 repeat containing protein, putative [Babesia ovata]GBE59848.1 WD-40 repeat containing protein, putative [Babesia ovata]